MDFSNYSEKELLQIYKNAKDAYYNGEEIMSDIEFDELEEYLGLSNKSKVGARRNEKYTVKHPVLMGSLSKVQVKENKDGFIDWEQIVDDIKSYIFKYNASSFIITPKYDGLSFEAVIKVNPGLITQDVVSISSRGDGEYGQDWMDQLYDKVGKNLVNYIYYGQGEHFKFSDATKYTLRGEVVIDKDIYLKKYSDEYANPRSFVSGIMNKDYDKTDAKYMEALNDLDIVIYDVKVIANETINDYDWTMFPQLINKPDFYRVSHAYFDPFNVNYFKKLYDDFSDYRKACKYALDGFVIKPYYNERKNDFKALRQKDCIAVKFMPMLQETEIINISWNLGKTGEYIPTIITNPVEMDGKMISRASGSNYGKLIDNKISIGTKVILSLAGDIIPFIYKVTNTDNYNENNLNLPTDVETYVDDCHLYAILNEDDKKKNKFINSASSLNIAHIGPATSKQILEYITKDNGLTDEFFGETTQKEIPTNILLVSPDDIYFGAGAGKSGDNAKKAFVDALNKLRLFEIIKSCNFRFCGAKVAEQIENYLLGNKYDFTSMASEGYDWVFNKESSQYKELEYIVNSLSKTFDDFKERIVETVVPTSDQIPVILTGEPNDYTSKAEFIKLNPQYRVTGKWTEVQIVFTNSLESNTGKMKKAREKGIEIRLY